MNQEVSFALKNPRWRTWKNRAVTIWFSLFGGLMLLILGSLIWELVSRGHDIISPYFLTVSMNGVYGGMKAGGIYHALVGTLQITLLAAVLSIPVGILVAIFLEEYDRGSRFGQTVVVLVDVMTGIPSIVAGLFATAAFAWLIGPAYRSGLMGAVALSVLMVPIVIKSSRENLRLVPPELREAAYALGVPKWKTVIWVVLREAVPGLLTSVIVAVARVVGETAPLLITAGYFQAINTNPFSGRMTTLPVYIYQEYTATVSCAVGAVDCWPTINLDRAWGAALVLVALVLGLNLGVRLLTKVCFRPGRT